MQLSVCIVSYNCRDALMRCLRSIQEHAAGVEHEVIVVDNASTDGSAEAAERQFINTRVVRNAENRGFAAAVNQAVGLSSGEVLLLLNPDCELTHGAVDHLWLFLHERPWVGACGPRLVRPDGQLIRSCRRFPSLWTVACEALGLSRIFPRSRFFAAYELGGWSYADRRRVDWVSGAAIAIPRRVWDTVGEFDERFFIYAEELDWFRRLAAARLECWYVPEAEVVHHEGASWTGIDELRALWAHWSLWEYFAKHHGRACAAAARLLTAVGALMRAWAWAIAGVVPRWRAPALARVKLHLAVLSQCILGRRPAKPGGQP